MTGEVSPVENKLDPSISFKNEHLVDNPQLTKKRGPSTPLASSVQHHIVRRKLTVASGPKRRIQFENMDLLETMYQNWLLKQELNNMKAIVEYMEVERKFTESSS